MTTAIIGANGFLGRIIAELLISNNESVISVYNSSKGNILEGTEAISLEEFLNGDARINNIIFSAGSFRNTIVENIYLNCDVLYKLTKKYSNSRFVYISSANVYGNSPDVVTEDSPFYNPNSYGLSKLSGEFIVSGLMSYAIVRPVYLYGPDLENGSFLPFIKSQAKENGIIPLYGQGEREQDYLHVNDAADLIIKSLFKGENGIYLGASGKSVSNKRIAEIICDTLGRESCKIKYGPHAETSPSLYYNATRTKKDLEWYPKISIEEGIKSFVQ